MAPDPSETRLLGSGQCKFLFIWWIMLAIRVSLAWADFEDLHRIGQGLLSLIVLWTSLTRLILTVLLRGYRPFKGVLIQLELRLRSFLCRSRIRNGIFPYSKLMIENAILWYVPHSWDETVGIGWLVCWTSPDWCWYWFVYGWYLGPSNPGTGWNTKFLLSWIFSVLKLTWIVASLCISRIQ